MPCIPKPHRGHIIKDHEPGVVIDVFARYLTIKVDMITETPDIIDSLAQAKAMDQTEGGTAVLIIRPVVDKAIEVEHDDGDICVGASVDIHIGYDVINAGLALHNVLVNLD